ncbi:hypothetical protein KDK88_03355, partial [bacterium]|nr:hypothetical protein [bacterium]
MEMRALIVLAVLTVLHVLITRKELREYRDFQGYDDTNRRQGLLRTWLLRSLLVHGLAAVAVLIGMGRGEALLRLPSELAAAAAALRPEGDGAWSGILRGFALALPVCLVVLPTALTVVDIRRRSARGERLRDDPAVQARNTSSLFPRNAAER